MSRQFRYRVTAIVLGGFFFGVPLAMNRTAGAGELGACERPATFEGGRFVTSCKSRPNAAAVPVALPSLPVPPTAPSRLSRPKTPGIAAAGSARPNAVLSALPHRTEPAVQLSPGDPDLDRPRPVHPSVDRPRPVRPSVDRPRTVRPSADRSRAHRPTTDRSGTSRPSVRHTRPQVTGTSGWTRPQHAPRGGTKLKAKTATGTAGAAAGGRAGGTGVSAPAGVPRLDVTATSLGAEPSTPASSPSTAAELLTATRPVPVGNRIGLLGVIAAVCAVGVTIAAIRSIVSKRANHRIVA